MAIDILFIIMAAFGFYFGFTFGLAKVVIVVISLSSAILAAMAMTPAATNLVIDTFQVNSLLLPFITFFITLLVVLMLSRMLTKLLEEAIDAKQFDSISQGIGGIVMALVFTLLYSVLVVFFGEARVITLIFNQDIITTKKDKEVRLGLEKVEVGNSFPISMKILRDSTVYTFKGEGDLNFGSKEIDEETHESYVAGSNDQFKITAHDTIIFESVGQMQIMVGQLVACFCDSTIVVTAQNDSISFNCSDKDFSSKSPTSFFYKYIEIIPKKGTKLMEGMIPFVGYFVDYMTVALDRLEKGNQKKTSPIQVYSNENHKKTSQPQLEEPVKDIWIEEDIINFSIDTTDMPSVKPTEEQDIDYEG